MKQDLFCSRGRLWLSVGKLSLNGEETSAVVSIKCFTLSLLWGKDFTGMLFHGPYQASSFLGTSVFPFQFVSHYPSNNSNLPPKSYGIIPVTCLTLYIQPNGKDLSSNHVQIWTLVPISAQALSKPPVVLLC